MTSVRLISLWIGLFLILGSKPSFSYFGKETITDDYSYRVLYLFDPSCNLPLDAEHKPRIDAELEVISSVTRRGYLGCLITAYDIDVRKPGLYSFSAIGFIKSMALVWEAGFRSIPVLYENDTAVADIELGLGQHRVYALGKVTSPASINRFGVGNAAYLVWPSAKYHRESFLVGAMRGICLGILGIMCLFFLFMTREHSRFFLIYGIFIFCNIAFIESMRSLSAEVLGYRSGQYYFESWIFITQVTGSLTQLLLGVFFANFYELKTTQPRLHKWFLVFFVLIVLQIPVTLLQVPFGYIYTTVVMMISALILIATSMWYSIKHGGLYHLVFGGYIVMVSCSHYWVLSVLGVFEIKSLWGRDVHLIGSTIEVILFSIATSLKLNNKFAKQQRENEHVLKQLEKIVYPHQLERIREGSTLEETMPTGKAEAHVLSFDIIGSSKIQHEQVKNFIETAIERCVATMTQRYDSKTLTADAYRIKVLGDGFLCSVGFPFASPGSENVADASVRLAMKLVETFDEVEREFQYSEPIYCAIGVAQGAIEAFYPKSGTKEYDLYGPAIVLATRYEQLRKYLFTPEKSDYIILQEQVYLSLSPERKNEFSCIELAERHIRVRDDDTAVRVYVWAGMNSAKAFGAA